jgi:hypothetical protein
VQPGAWSTPNGWRRRSGYGASSRKILEEFDSRWTRDVHGRVGEHKPAAAPRPARAFTQWTARRLSRPSRRVAHRESRADAFFLRRGELAFPTCHEDRRGLSAHRIVTRSCRTAGNRIAPRSRAIGHEGARHLRSYAGSIWPAQSSVVLVVRPIVRHDEPGDQDDKKQKAVMPKKNL